MEGKHLDEEEIERYSLAKSPEAELSRVEEHLLVCAECRRQVELSDTYVRSMQGAARLARRQRPFHARWTFGLVLAAALLMGVVLVRRTSQPPFPVSLSAMRGVAVSAQAPPGRPLRLQPDLTGLPAASSYRLEMVDQAGRKVWEGPFPGTAADPATAGTYFVRLYAPGGTLLREYGLEVSTALK